MQYHVIHSTDPYLLARLCTDLQMEGERFDIEWCTSFHPFRHLEDNWSTKCLYMARTSQNIWEFHNHKAERYDSNGRIDIQITLTARNYIQVLTKILEP